MPNIVGSILERFWQWYTTTFPHTGVWGSDYKDQLVLLGSVAVVIWTGGLIAYQIKKYSINTSIGLDLLQNAFMAPLFVLVESTLWFRYTATLFLLYYVVLHCISLFRYRTLSSSARTVHNKYPEMDEDHVRRVREDVRNYSFYSLAIVLTLYTSVIINPTHAMVAFLGLPVAYLGLQLILSVLATIPDKQSLTDIILQALVTGLPQQAEIAGQASRPAITRDGSNDANLDGGRPSVE
jgi:hypothetical protein